jgi:DNA-binding transcriptional LysR family regulator
MDIRQLKAFIAVFDERNITLAAQKLHITQPTLSVTIRQLEESLETVLFQRQPRGVAVTEAARLLYPQARRLLDQANNLRQQFRQHNKRLPLTLGVECDVSGIQVEALLTFTLQHIPNLRLSIVPGCAGDARLAAEEARCEDELFLPLWDESYLLAVAANSPLAGLALADMDLLAQADWIACPEHPSHQRLLAMHSEQGAALTSAAHAGNLTLALHMVAAGIGIALLPSSLIAERSSVVAIPLSSPTLTRRIGLCYAAQALDNPALQMLHRELIAHGLPARNG